jgi:uncharacterized protein DUF4038/collagenase-like protein with putative collagen-binding domain/immunoglobulin I-set domain protein
VTSDSHSSTRGSMRPGANAILILFVCGLTLLSSGCAGTTQGYSNNTPPGAPSITTQPANQTAGVGANVTFIAAASGTPTPTVQWQVSTDGGATFSNLTGATSTTLTFATTTSQNGYQYRAVFTNTAGSATTTAATLAVDFAPTVTTNPASQSVTNNSSVGFTAAATGNPAPTVQWQVSTNGGSTFSNVSAATSTTLTFTATTSQNGNQYRAVFTNSVGTAMTTAATLAVSIANSAPVITTNPTTQTVTAGANAAFTAAASGTPTPTVQWQVSTNGGSTFSNVSGATSTTLTFTATTSQNGNQYRAVFTNSVGTAMTTAATLTVDFAPIVTTNPTNQTVTAGTSVSFTVAATGNPTPTVQWQVSTDGGATFTNLTGATSATLTFATITLQNGNQYRAVFTNTAGSAKTTAATLTVTTSGSKWPIKASANGRYFTDATGAPWLMVADAAHHLMTSLPQSSVAAYLTDRVKNGFNTINFYAVSTCGSTISAASDGTLPFTGVLSGSYPPTSASTYDLSKPNPAYWSEVDSVISQAAADGLVVLVDPAPWGCGFGTTLQNNGAGKDLGFGQFLGMRYKNFTNIIWQLGQDFNGSSFPSSSDLSLVAQVMAGIASADPTTNALQTVQLNYLRSYSTQANSLGNTTYNTDLTANFLYTYYETYDYALKAYNALPILPIFLGEANYETANNTGKLSSAADAFITRMEMWWTMTSGGAGHEFGNEHVNHFDSTSPTWQSQLDTTATLQVKYLTSLFKQLQWWTLAPEVNHQVVTAGHGTYSTTNENLYTATYATTVWNPTLALVYTPVSTTLTVNMVNFSKSMTASWYDPTTGTSTPISGSPFPNSGSQNFMTPSTAHSDGTHDWVLVLQ